MFIILHYSNISSKYTKHFKRQPQWANFLFTEQRLDHGLAVLTPNHIYYRINHGTQQGQQCSEFYVQSLTHPSANGFEVQSWGAVPGSERVGYWVSVSIQSSLHALLPGESGLPWMDYIQPTSKSCNFHDPAQAFGPSLQKLSAYSQPSNLSQPVMVLVLTFTPQIQQFQSSEGLLLHNQCHLLLLSLLLSWLCHVDPFIGQLQNGSHPCTVCLPILRNDSIRRPRKQRPKIKRLEEAEAQEARWKKSRPRQAGH